MPWRRAISTSRCPRPPTSSTPWRPTRWTTPAFTPGAHVAQAATGATFEGFRRPGGRGVGTRNFVVVLATTSRANGFVRAVAERAAAKAPTGIDGVVAVTHTEGGGQRRPNNLGHVMRVLAGFMVHPNVGAVLAADDGAGAYGNDDLRRFMAGRGDPLGHVSHAFFRIERGFEDEVARADSADPRLAARGRRRRAHARARRRAPPRAAVRRLGRVLRRLRQRTRRLGGEGGHPPRRRRQPGRDRRAHRRRTLRAGERARCRHRARLPGED